MICNQRLKLYFDEVNTHKKPHYLVLIVVTAVIIGGLSAALDIHALKGLTEMARAGNLSAGDLLRGLPRGFWFCIRWAGGGLSVVAGLLTWLDPHTSTPRRVLITCILLLQALTALVMAAYGLVAMSII